MADLLLYGIIGDQYDKLDAATVTTAIRASTGPLAVRINSPGGYVMEGLAIIEALRAYPGKVTIHIDGLAASMASAIAMVGAETIMASSALFMIHKPWDSTIGNADDMRRDAAKLDRIEAQLLGIYEKRTGQPRGQLAEWLAAETWFTPEEALAAGFVTSISEPVRIAAMAKATGYGFRHLPDTLKQQEAPLADQNDTATAVATERTRISTIMALCDQHRLPGEFARGLIDGDKPLADARALILDRLAARDDAMNIGHQFPTGGGHITLDNPATYGAAIQGALLAKISGKAAEGPASEFQGMSVVDMQRDYLTRGGARDAYRLSPDRVSTMAMGGGGRGVGWRSAAAVITQTTSDFPDLVGSAAHQYLIERYKRQESQLKRLARKRNRSNFLHQFAVQRGGFGYLDEVREGGEYRSKTFETSKEGYPLRTYGNTFNVSRQMLINDQLGALADVLQTMAQAAVDTEAVLLAAAINAGYKMGDGKDVFHADRRNLSPLAAKPNIASLDEGRLAMRSQKDLDGVGLIDANPKFLLVPVSLQTAAETLVASTIAPGKTDDVNPFAGKLEPLSDPRITNPTAWFLFADPEFSPALQYSYLDGHDAPETFTEDGWRVDGVEYKVRHDFGAGWLDYRFAWKNPGAA